MKYAVLGSPISHSKSPLIHQAAYRKLGISASYEAIDVTSDQLNTFLDSNAEHRGLSLTMPLKETAFKLAELGGWEIDETSCALRAGNTLVHTDEHWSLHNTDVFGASKALESISEKPVKLVAILGSGATAKSVALAALRTFSNLDRLTIFARNPDAAAEIFATLKNAPELKSHEGIEFVWNSIEAAADFGGADLTVNTLPADVASNIEVDVPFTESWVFDVTYHPWPTPFSSAWPEDHRISGLAMLIWQAVAQIRLFVGNAATQELPNEAGVVEVMFQAVESKVD